ncbi:MAG TPA: alpha/beta hydrolase [Acidimicrobiia bacterium]
MLDENPFALESAAAPSVSRKQVNGTIIYAEVRGSGPGLLLIGAADEDAEFYRPVAERIPQHTVITYDRRGTFRSGRELWPGSSSIHADDAASLVRSLGFAQIDVFGGSAGGIVATQLALRHPGLVRRALIFEPGYFHVLEGGDDLLTAVRQSVQAHLASNPGDWPGAAATLGRTAAELSDGGRGNFLAPPAGSEWYGARADRNAESLIRGDLPLTAEAVDLEALASCDVDIGFSHGDSSLPLFVDITERLGGVRGDIPDVVRGVGHGVYYSPEAIASYISDKLG